MSLARARADVAKRSTLDEWRLRKEGYTVCRLWLVRKARLRGLTLGSDVQATAAERAAQTLDEVALEEIKALNLVVIPETFAQQLRERGLDYQPSRLVHARPDDEQDE